MITPAFAHGTTPGRVLPATGSAPSGASIESARVPGIVGEVHHLRHLTPVFANDVVRGDFRLAHFEPSDGALVAAFAIVQDYEVDTRAAATRKIGGCAPAERGKEVRHLKTHALARVKDVPFFGGTLLTQLKREWNCGECECVALRQGIDVFFARAFYISPTRRTFREKNQAITALPRTREPPPSVARRT